MAYVKRPNGKAQKWMPYDPKVWMDGAPVQCFIFDKTPVFKYVGIPLQADAKSDQINAAWLAGVEKTVETVNESGLTEVQKVQALSLWMWAVQAWELMTIDPPDSLVNKAQAAIQKQYKAGLGVRKQQNVAVLYLPTDQRGCRLTHLPTMSKAMWAVKSHILKHSADPVCRRLYLAKV